MQVKERIRKGIPDPLRGKVWYSLCNAQKYREEKPNLYQVRSSGGRVDLDSTHSWLVVLKAILVGGQFKRLEEGYNQEIQTQDVSL